MAAEAAEGAGEGAAVGAAAGSEEAGAGGGAARVRRRRRQQPRGRRYAQQYGQQARQVGRRARFAPGRSSHQGAILAEFLVCIAIIVLTPIATGGSGGLSPYAVSDLKRMAAIAVVFFGLALVPGDNGSRVAAWLGFLVMLVLLMNDLSGLSTVLGIFSAGGTEPPGATSPGG